MLKTVGSIVVLAVLIDMNSVDGMFSTKIDDKDTHPKINTTHFVRILSHPQRTE